MCWGESGKGDEALSGFHGEKGRKQVEKQRRYGIDALLCHIYLENFPLYFVTMVKGGGLQGFGGRAIMFKGLSFNF